MAYSARFIALNLISLTLVLTGCSKVADEEIEQDPFAKVVFNDGGDVTPSEVRMEHNQEYRLNVVVNEHYYIDEVSGCDATLEDDSILIVGHEEDCQLEVLFSPTLYHVGSEVTGSGSLEPESVDLTYKQQFRFEIKAEVGHKLSSVEGCNGVIEGSHYVVNSIMNDCNITASFVEDIESKSKLLGHRMIKIDDNGGVLSSASEKWSCVLDENSGLMWEVKQEEGLRSKQHFYVLKPDPDDHRVRGQCESNDCSVEYFIEQVNSKGLCGHNDWRLPTRSELLSLIHHGRAAPNFNSDYFESVKAGWYWSSTKQFSRPSRQRGLARNTWNYAAMSIPNGRVDGAHEALAHYVRLVRAFEEDLEI